MGKEVDLSFQVTGHYTQKTLKIPSESIFNQGLNFAKKLLIKYLLCLPSMIPKAVGRWSQLFLPVFDCQQIY